MTTATIKHRPSSKDGVVGALYYHSINERRTKQVNTGFLSFAEEVVMQKKKTGHHSTARRYTSAVNSFRRFLSVIPDIPLDDIDTCMMEEYESWMRTEGLCPNSTSANMRNLRAIFNKAVDDGKTWQRSPFRHVYTGVDKTRKRAYSTKTIAAIRDLDLSSNPKISLARDIFMFSFYTRGMSLIDMAYLQKSDLHDGYIEYTRQKTGQRIRVRWKPQMQAIVDKYKHETSHSPFLLPLIKGNEKDRRQYNNIQRKINRHLKKLAEMLGLTEGLTLYVARHSWASSAQSNNIPIATISHAMGHDSERTTRIYLADLDTKDIDKANDKVIKSLDG